MKVSQKVKQSKKVFMKTFFLLIGWAIIKIQLYYNTIFFVQGILVIWSSSSFVLSFNPLLDLSLSHIASYLVVYMSINEERNNHLVDPLSIKQEQDKGASRCLSKSYWAKI